MEVNEAYKFCPRCGAKGNSDGRKLVCPECSLDTYFSPKPVQELVLENDKGELLFCIRAMEPQKGLLDLPGGFVEPNETFEESVKREVKEERGIDIDAGNLYYLRSDFTQYLFQGVNYDVVGMSFYAKLPANAVIKPADDVERVEFYKLEDVPMEQLAFTTSSELIELLKQRASKGR